MDAESSGWLGCVQRCFTQFECKSCTSWSGAAPTYVVAPTLPAMGKPVCLTASSGHYFTSIQAAVAAAEAGGPANPTIAVCAGTYAEQVTVTVSLSIVGVATGTAPNCNFPKLVPPPGGMVPGICYPIAQSLQSGLPIAAQICAVGNPSIIVNVSNLWLNATGNLLAPGTATSPQTAYLVGIYYQNASGTIAGNHIEDEMTSPEAYVENGYGIFVESGTPPAGQGYGSAGSPTVNITNNTVMDFEANGITATGSNTTAVTTGNWIGSDQGANSILSQNGIVYENAKGSICSNSVANLISKDPYDDAAGGIIVASEHVSVTGNTVTSVDSPILTLSIFPTASNPTDAPADYNTISGNTVSGTNYTFIPVGYKLPVGADGIDICSNGNTVTSNTISGFSNPVTDNAGIHLDTGCPGAGGTYDATSGNYNTVEHNKTSYSCTGIAQGGEYNDVWYNDVYAATSAIFAGDYCGSGVTSPQTGDSDICDDLHTKCAPIKCVPPPVCIPHKRHC